MASGHIRGAREMAAGLDPFKSYSREIRWEAWGGSGHDLDDSAAFPTAAMHIMNSDNTLVKLYTQHKQSVRQQIGAYFFPATRGPNNVTVLKPLCYALISTGGWTHGDTSGTLLNGGV